MTPNNSGQLLHFNEYFKIIRNRSWLIFTIIALTVISGYCVTNFVIPKTYTATAQIQILPRGVVVVPSLNNTRTDAGFDPINFQAESEILKSADVLMPIIRDQQLDKIWAQRLKTGLDVLSPQDALSYMKSILKLDSPRETNLINITVASDVPRECSNIANALAERYQTKRELEESQRNSHGLDSLRAQIADQQKVVDEKRQEVETMRQELGKANVEIPGGAGSSLENVPERRESDLNSLKKSLLDAQEDYDARQVLLTRAGNLPDDQFVTTLEGLGHQEGDVVALRADALKMETDITNLLNAGYGENNLKVQSMQAELDARKKQIKDVIAGLRRALGVETDMAKSRVALLQAQVDDLTEKIRKDTSNDLVPFRDKEREFEEKQSLLDALNVRLQGDIADGELQQSTVKIISPADVPETPSSPKKTLNYALSVMAGIFAGLGIAFFIEYLDTSVKTMADAETLLGLPVLTVIPNKGGPLSLVQDSGRSAHAEAYRILRAKLNLKVQDGIGPSLTMMSGGPGEGKSTTIYNLAVVCARAGQSVILVDGDLRRPTLHELLDVSNESGLSNYLRGEGEAVRFIQPTALPKLHVLPAGNMPLSEIGVLAGDKIRAMLDDLKARYDLVLIDAPPVLGISDGSIIAREVDYVILVIQHRRYPRDISLRTKRAIEEVHGNCVGMVLNRVVVKSDDSYYYYSNYGNYYKRKRGRAKKVKETAKANGKPVAPGARGTDLESDSF